MGYQSIFFSKDTVKWTNRFYVRNQLISVELENEAICIRKNHLLIPVQEAEDLVGKTLLEEETANLQRFYSEYAHLKKPALTSLYDKLLGISYLKLPDYPIAQENIAFELSKQESLIFEYSFFSRFDSTSVYRSFSMLRNKIEEVMKGGPAELVPVCDYEIFEEYYRIEQETTCYFGAIDNEQAHIPQERFIISTKDFHAVIADFLNQFCSKD